jgi:hypothetical protein
MTLSNTASTPPRPDQGISTRKTGSAWWIVPRSRLPSMITRRGHPFLPPLIYVKAKQLVALKLR